MKRELTPDEEASVVRIIKELCGYSVEQAEAILKVVGGELKERAIIEEGN